MKTRYWVFALILTYFTPLWAAEGTAYNYPVPKSDINTSFYSRAFTSEPYEQPKAKRVKNVIFCIGDGMGFGQVALTRIKTVGLQGRLYMERLPVCGAAWTHCANAIVTDSAAAGTALACGIKTNEKMIGQDPEGNAYKSLMTVAQEQGMKTGVVVTCTISHATPASYYAHVPSRGDEATICEQLVTARLNVALGGGLHYFIPQSREGSKRKDELDLLTLAQQSGIRVITDPGQLWSAHESPLLGLFQMSSLTTEYPEPSLDEMTCKALSLLDEQNQDQGFFLMVEGSQIDWACHSNDETSMIRQTLLFDQAVKSVIDYTLQHPQTLVIVTADHETGGLTLGQAGNRFEPKVQWASTKHSALPVPIFAIGPGSKQFEGMIDNTEIPKKIAKLLGFAPFPVRVK